MLLNPVLNVNSMKELKIMLQMPGLVIFDPVVMKEFITDNHVSTPNILENFINDPDLGNEAIRSGCLISIYSIAQGDYRVILNESDHSSLPIEWVLFETPTFVLKVSSNRVIVSDIWAMLNWDEETYVHFGQYPVDERYASAEFSSADAAELPNGLYEVKIVGFRNSKNQDLENQEYGYELLLTRTDTPRFGVIGSIDNIQFDVRGLPVD